jgi:hypothetical protein
MSVFYIEDFPAEAIADCSKGGQDATEAVEFWIERLGFQVPADEARECLGGYGAWDTAELADDALNAQRFFWIMMGDFAEWDGTAESNCGSDIFTTD